MAAAVRDSVCPSTNKTGCDEEKKKSLSVGLAAAAAVQVAVRRGALSTRCFDLTGEYSFKNLRRGRDSQERRHDERGCHSKTPRRRTLNQSKPQNRLSHSKVCLARARASTFANYYSTY